MLVSGLRKRSISDQSETLEFAFLANASQTTGVYSFGFSGDNGSSSEFLISLKSGWIFSPKHQELDTFNANFPVSISGQVGQHSYDLWINNRIVVLGDSWPTGKYSWLVAEAKHGSFDFQGSIKGVLPSYSLQETGKYLYQNYTVTGKIINNNPDRRFRVFNATIEQSDSPYFITGFSTGNIGSEGYVAFSSDLVGLGDYVIPVLLETNFGELRYNFVVSGDYGLVPDTYLNISPDTINIPNQTIKPYMVEVSNYPSGTQIGVFLQYYSGITGNIYYFEQITRTGARSMVSGYLTGCGALSAQRTGLVSGLDVKTNIWEIGTGTGILSTAQICPTGFVSGNYVLNLTGRGQGYLTIDYLASGLAYGIYSGEIPMTGTWVTSIANSFVGTGDNPGIAIGTVPVGTGTQFVYPTGCVSLLPALAPITDYYTGIILYEKIFQGNINVPYSILSVGWGTGNYRSGYVDSSFVKDFVQGQYTFTKFFSGVVFGSAINTGVFDVMRCIDSYTPTTSGILSGNFSIAALLSCNNFSSLTTIPVYGYPSQVFDGEGNEMSPNKVLLVRPSEGFSSNENLTYWSGGGFTRTTISHSGYTPSGTGFFDSVIGDCDNFGVWKSSLATSSGFAKYDSFNNTFGKISSKVYLSGSGNYEVNNYFTGITGHDSGVLHFAISGSGLKTMAFRAINTDNANNRSLMFYLFKNALPSDIWAAEGINDSIAYRRWQTTVMDGADWNDTVVVLENLSSGIYSLYTVSRDVEPPQVFFKKPVFSGCESAGNLRIDISVTGELRQPIWFEMMEYEEITAHSGVNYDPVFVPSGFFLPGDDLDHRDFSFTIPIYDNASFGNNHEFIIRLSNCSGCSFLAGGQEATGRIIENDNATLLINQTQIQMPVTDIFGGIANVKLCDNSCSGLFVNVFSGVSGNLGIDCSYVSPIPVPTFTRHAASISATNNAESLPCPPCQPKPCCECDNVVTVNVQCSGHSGVFTSKVVVGNCDEINGNGASSTNGYVYLGKICSARGSKFRYQYQGCHLSVKVVPDDCLVPLLNGAGGCTGEGNPCPSIGTEWPIDGCNNDFSLCSGNCGSVSGTVNINAEQVGGCQFYKTTDCPDYSKYVTAISGNVTGKSLPVGDNCRYEHVFVKANCSHSYGGGPWTFVGYTVPPSIQSQLPVCPPVLL